LSTLDLLDLLAHRVASVAVRAATFRSDLVKEYGRAVGDLEAAGLPGERSPVKALFSRPNSSGSISADGRAAPLTLTMGRSFRALAS